jgi:elongation factor Ts
MVKELRDKTGAGMMDCKKALAEAEGDLEKAVDELRKRGRKIADKAGARTASEGRIFNKIDGAAGVLLELNCTTDFVARNDDFSALGNELVHLAHASGADGAGAFQAVPHPSGKPVSEVLTEAKARMGENVVVSRVERWETAAGGCISGYVHFNGKTAVMIELAAGKPETFADDRVRQLAVDLAQHVAFSAPVALDRDSAPADLIARERAIYVEQVKLEGKPEKIWDKIVEGKMSKFFQDVCLLDQAFVKDNDKTIRGLIAETGKQVGDTLALTRFVRYEVGGAEPKSDNGG